MSEQDLRGVSKKESSDQVIKEEEERGNISVLDLLLQHYVLASIVAKAAAPTVTWNCAIDLIAAIEAAAVLIPALDL